MVLRLKVNSGIVVGEVYYWIAFVYIVAQYFRKFVLRKLGLVTFQRRMLETGTGLLFLNLCYNY